MLKEKWVPLVLFILAIKSELYRQASYLYFILYVHLSMCNLRKDTCIILCINRWVKFLDMALHVA